MLEKAKKFLDSVTLSEDQKLDRFLKGKPVTFFYMLIGTKLKINRNVYFLGNYFQENMPVTDIYNVYHTYKYVSFSHAGLIGMAACWFLLGHGSGPFIS